jgi:hypothetical protein
MDELRAPVSIRRPFPGVQEPDTRIVKRKRKIPSPIVTRTYIPSASYPYRSPKEKQIEKSGPKVASSTGRGRIKRNTKLTKGRKHGS